MKLIQRYPDLVTYADKHCNRVFGMARKWASVVGRKATNERAIQIYYIRNMRLAGSSPYHIAMNCLASELSDNLADPGPIQLSTELAATGMHDVNELRAIIRSDKMYKNEVVHAQFCAGLESGVAGS